MIALDASVLIAHFDADDSHHGQATAVILEQGAGGLAIHPLNLAEVLVAQALAGNADQQLDDVMALGVEVVDMDQRGPLRLAELRASTRLRLPDCCALDVALNTRASLATFDDRLRRAATARGIAVIPAHSDHEE
ncbi:MAG TPA: PIN domain-containing protein [Nocardioidaceae bacterium]|nr:PIN domain-containing protein [Nocardioidaceae bacterium]